MNEILISLKVLGVIGDAVKSQSKLDICLP